MATAISFLWSRWDFSYALVTAVVSSVGILTLFLIKRGVEEGGISSKSYAEYFGANASLAPVDTTNALSATWVMLGNVVVANMFIAQIFGIYWSAWVLITWFWAFHLISFRTDAIQKALISPDDTLHAFLHRSYGSDRMRVIAALITITVAVGVFAIEIVAGAAVISAFLPSSLSKYYLPFITIVLVVAMCSGAVLGGLRAVVRADAALWFFIVIALIVLLIISVWTYILNTANPPWFHIFQNPPAIELKLLVPFLLGMLALQVPLLLCDYATWQRIKATKKAESGSLAKELFRHGIKQAVLWLIPMIAGILVFLTSTKPTVGIEWNLYNSAQPLFDTLNGWITSDLSAPARVLPTPPWL